MQPSPGRRLGRRSMEVIASVIGTYHIQHMTIAAGASPEPETMNADTRQ